MDLLSTTANVFWSAANLPGMLAYLKALSNPAAAQEARLFATIRQNVRSSFGKVYQFDQIKTYEDFAKRVPLSSYDDLEPWVERIQCGESNVLTSEAVTHLVPTSGTTKARKLIPFTPGLQREFDSAIAPWLLDLYRRIPALTTGPAYWMISPPMIPVQEEQSAVPIGLDSDAAYLGGAKRRLAEAIMAVPSEIQHIRSPETFRYFTLLCLLRCPDLRLISIWHPSFLSLLLDALPVFWGELIKDIRQGGCSRSDEFCNKRLLEKVARPLPKRATELRIISPTEPSRLWPELRLISCWADGAALTSIGDLKESFPDVLLQPKGLIATEAFVTLPFENLHPLAITSHFFEFIDMHGRVQRVEDLREGAEYEVVVTTAGGLWRYRLGDRVIVTEFLKKTPCCKFVGRTHDVSDRFGEKLGEGFVSYVLGKLFERIGEQPRFFLLAPDESAEGWGYTLYVEYDANTISAEQLDAELSRNPHYSVCRSLGQLLPIRIFRVRQDGFASFVRRAVRHGARLGDVKPSVLSRVPGWSCVFSGDYLTSNKIVTSL